MALRQLEAAILKELKKVAKNNKIKQKDIMEWSTGELTPQNSEKLFHLPELRINVCVKLPDKNK